MSKIALSINICAADWTAEKAIIASNEKLKANPHPDIHHIM